MFSLSAYLGVTWWGDPSKT